MLARAAPTEIGKLVFGRSERNALDLARARSHSVSFDFKQVADAQIKPTTQTHVHDAHLAIPPDVCRLVMWQTLLATEFQFAGHAFKLLGFVLTLLRRL